MKQKQFNEILLKNNRELQLIIAIEEMSELQKDICKYLRSDKTCAFELHRSHIKEELADVQLCLGQVRQYFNLDQAEIYSIKRKKMQRTLKRCIK